MFEFAGDAVHVGLIHSVGIEDDAGRVAAERARRKSVYVIDRIRLHGIEQRWIKRGLRRADQVLDDVGDLSDLERTIDDGHESKKAARGRVALVFIGDDYDFGRNPFGTEVVEQSIHILAQIGGNDHDVERADADTIPSIGNVDPDADVVAAAL